MPIKKSLSKPAKRVIRQLQEAGYDAYVVGGAVRDLMIGIEPKDYDVATDATPEQVKSVFKRQARIIGRRFKLAHVYADGELIEVSTFRREPDMNERKGREEDDGLIVWRDNEYGTLEDDARRRDFTVNAVYFDPVCDEGRLVDYVNGIADLENGVVRTIGDPAVRMAEDPVRMLRACKLVGQYGFTVEPELAKVIREKAEMLQLSSRARLLEELFKIIRKPHMRDTLAACQEFGLLQYFMPMLSKGWDEPSGQLCQQMLQIRDEGLATGTIFPSRVTGLAIAMLPFVADAFGKGQHLEALWENFFGVNKVIRHEIRAFMDPYDLPRYSLAKLCDVLLLQPKLLEGKNRGRIMRHPEYDRGRDVFQVFGQAVGLTGDILDKWPNQQSKPKRRKRRRRRRKKPSTGA